MVYDVCMADCLSMMERRNWAGAHSFPVACFFVRYLSAFLSALFVARVLPCASCVLRSSSLSPAPFWRSGAVTVTSLDHACFNIVTVFFSRLRLLFIRPGSCCWAPDYRE